MKRIRTFKLVMDKYLADSVGREKRIHKNLQDLFGMSDLEWGVMRECLKLILYKRHEYTIVQLAILVPERIDVSPQTVKNTLHKMERAGIVEREGQRGPYYESHQYETIFRTTEKAIRGLFKSI